MEMDYKRNERYFSGETMARLSIYCWILAVVCVVLVFLRLRIPYLYWIAGGVALLSVIGGFVFSSHSVSDKEYDSVCNGLEKAFRTRFVEFVSTELNRNNGRGKAPVAVDEEKIRYSRSFLYEGDLRLRVAQDGSRRTDKFSMAAYLIDKHAVFIGYEMHGLVTEAHEEVFGMYAYEEIEQIESFRPEGTNELAEYGRVRIKLKAKKTPIEFWRANDAELDELVTAVRNRLTNESAEDASAE